MLRITALFRGITFIYHTERTYRDQLTVRFYALLDKWRTEHLIILKADCFHEASQVWRLFFSSRSKPLIHIFSLFFLKYILELSIHTGVSLLNQLYSLLLIITKNYVETLHSFRSELRVWSINCTNAFCNVEQRLQKIWIRFRSRFSHICNIQSVQIQYINLASCRI